MPQILNKRTAIYIPKDAIYVGRPSKWGNPYSVALYGRKHAIKKYSEYLARNPQLVADARKELAGKDLVCWCYPEACHAGVLIQIANGKRKL